ncbi:hypothetical protein ACWGH5_20200 [Streptomyces sp. NPDC054864]
MSVLAIGRAVIVRSSAGARTVLSVLLLSVQTILQSLASVTLPERSRICHALDIRYPRHVRYPRDTR